MMTKKAEKPQDTRQQTIRWPMGLGSTRQTGSHSCHTQASDTATMVLMIPSNLWLPNYAIHDWVM